jgi:hypothetical protein
MSKAVKERKAAQRKELTISKLAHGATTLKQAQAKNNPVEKARQDFWESRRFVGYGRIYNQKVA